MGLGPTIVRGDGDSQSAVCTKCWTKLDITPGCTEGKCPVCGNRFVVDTSPVQLKTVQVETILSDIDMLPYRQRMVSAIEHIAESLDKLRLDLLRFEQTISNEIRNRDLGRRIGKG